METLKEQIEEILLNWMDYDMVRIPAAAEQILSLLTKPSRPGFKKVTLEIPEGKSIGEAIERFLTGGGEDYHYIGTRRLDCISDDKFQEILHGN